MRPCTVGVDIAACSCWQRCLQSSDQHCVLVLCAVQAWRCSQACSKLQQLKKALPRARACKAWQRLLAAAQQAAWQQCLQEAREQEAALAIQAAYRAWRVRRVTAKQLAGVRRFQVGVVVCKGSAALPLALIVSNRVWTLTSWPHSLAYPAAGCPRQSGDLDKTYHFMWRLSRHGQLETSCMLVWHNTAEYPASCACRSSALGAVLLHR